MAARAIAQCPDRLPADIDDAYDAIEDAIAAAPIFFIIEFGRRMGSAIHEKFGVDPWAGCTCTPDGAEVGGARPWSSSLGKLEALLALLSSSKLSTKLSRAKRLRILTKWTAG